MPAISSTLCLRDDPTPLRAERIKTPCSASASSAARRRRRSRPPLRRRASRRPRPRRARGDGPRRVGRLQRDPRVAACVEIKFYGAFAESSRRPPRHRRDACWLAWRCRFLTPAEAGQPRHRRCPRPSDDFPHRSRRVLADAGGLDPHQSTSTASTDTRALCTIPPFNSARSAPTPRSVREETIHGNTSDADGLHHVLRHDHSRLARQRQPNTSGTVRDERRRHPQIRERYCNKPCAARVISIDPVRATTAPHRTDQLQACSTFIARVETASEDESTCRGHDFFRHLGWRRALLFVKCRYTTAPSMVGRPTTRSGRRGTARHRTRTRRP